MPSPAPGQMNVAAALQALQKQVDQLTRRPVSAGGLVIVDPTEPTSPATGQLWYDEDGDCTDCCTGFAGRPLMLNVGTPETPSWLVVSCVLGPPPEPYIRETAPWEWIITPFDPPTPDETYFSFRMNVYDGPNLYWYAFVKEDATGDVTWLAASGGTSSSGSAGFGRPSDYDLGPIQVQDGYSLHAVVVGPTAADEPSPYVGLDVYDARWKLVWVAP